MIQPLHLSLQDQIDRHNTRIQELEHLNLEQRIEALEGGIGGGKRKKKTRKKRGGLDSFPIGMLDQISQDTLYNNPHKDDLIRRLNHIWNILGEDEEEGTI